jgi:glycosyltransferase involved in cell wall biosynthesis
VLQTHGLKLPEHAVLEGRAVLTSARRAYHYAFGKRLLKGAAKVIAPSNSEKTSLEGIGLEGEKIAVMPSGVAPEDFSNPPGPDLFRERFGIPEEGRVILYVGRIAKSKGIETLVRAFCLLCKKRADVKLAIVGPDDGYLHVLKEMVRVLNLEGRVLFAGFLTHEEKLSAYSSADLVVYPGIYEGFPIVPLEAAIMARPLVVSNDPGMAFVGDSEFGLTFQYGNEHELTSRLDTILNDADLGRKLGETGKKCVLANYTWEIVTERIEQLYREIL